MKNYICYLLVVFSFLGTIVSDVILCRAAENPPKENELYAKAAVLMDGDSGRVLYSKNGTEAMANASTTKILTCIITLESGQMDEIVTASSRAAGAPKVHLGMRAKQRFYLRDLVYALMLESYNDCAVAIAEHIAGSVEEFAVLLNEKAKEIGCTDTYFITPNGLDATDENGFHHTTATDLARMMKYCISESAKAEEFCAITGTKAYSFCEIDSGRSYNCYNRNAFLSMMQGAFSGKTGFTGAAGYCYVGALKRNEKTYIVALLACGWPNNKTYKWSDSKKLMQYGIDNFEKVILTKIQPDREKLCDIYVANGQSEKIDEASYVKIKLGAGEGITDVLMAADEELRIVYQINRSLEAPVKANTRVGTVQICCDEEVLYEYPVYTAESVDAIDLRWCVKMIFVYFLRGIDFSEK